MKNSLGLLSILLGIGGFGAFLLACTFHLSLVWTIGIGMMIAGIVGGLVSNALEKSTDITSWDVKPDEGMRKADQGQLPLGGYTSGHR